MFFIESAAVRFQTHMDKQSMLIFNCITLLIKFILKEKAYKNKGPGY